MSHRTQITLTDAQYERLRAESERTGLSMAELVRRAIDRAYGEGDIARKLAALEASYGAWADRDDIVDGATYVRETRPGFDKRMEKVERRE